MTTTPDEVGLPDPRHDPDDVPEVPGSPSVPAIEDPEGDA